MTIKIHQIDSSKIAELISEEILISNVEDGTNLLGDLYYQDFDKVIIYEKNITPNFFDLKTGIAGEILQKFSNYRVKLVIVGDFSKYTSNSLNSFFIESNKRKHVNFVSTLSEAINASTIK